MQRTSHGQDGGLPLISGFDDFELSMPIVEARS